MTVIVEDTGTGIMIVVGDPRVPDIDVEAGATPPSPDIGILTIINFSVCWDKSFNNEQSQFYFKSDLGIQFILVQIGCWICTE